MSSLRRKWRRWARAVDTTILDEIRVDKVMFENYRHILDSNPSIQQPATFHRWVLGNYGKVLALQVRRLADNNPRSYSVRRMVGDILVNHRLITRTSYLRSHRPQERQYAERTWISYTDSTNPDVLPRGVCDRDLRALRMAAFRVSRLVDRDIAHLDRRRHSRKVLYEDVFEALEFQASLTAKYADLVGYRMPGTVRNGGYGEDWVRLFEQPWVVRPTED